MKVYNSFHIFKVNIKKPILINSLLSTGSPPMLLPATHCLPPSPTTAARRAEFVEKQGRGRQAVEIPISYSRNLAHRPIPAGRRVRGAQRNAPYDRRRPVHAFRRPIGILSKIAGPGR